jgi:hypothetical protein
MFGSSIIEVAIGMIFIYLLMSLVCSAANEIIEAKLKNRATDLESGIRELFNQEKGGDMVTKLYNHPLVHGLFPGRYEPAAGKPIGRLDYLKTTNLPAYIPARNFASAVIDIVLHPPTEDKIKEPDATIVPPASLATKGSANISAPGASSATGPTGASGAAPANPDASAKRLSIDNILAAIEGISESQVKRALRTLVEQSSGDVNKVRENIEGWFNSSMDRVSGWYKRRTKWIILGLGLAVTILLNVNSITIARRLSNDSTLRSVVVAQAEATANNPEALKGSFEEKRQELYTLGLPLGWQSGIDFIHPLKNPNFNLWDHFFLPWIGWLLTAAAISLGAPFWFDMLNKIMVIRSTVKPHEKSPEESSEDRQKKEDGQKK